MREPAYLTRRALAAALPIAVLAAAPAAAVSTSPHYPDADLLQLVASLQASEACREECDRQINEAFDRFEVPEIPEALIWRRSDCPGISTEHPSNHLAQYKIGGRLEWVYESTNDLPSRWTGPQPPPFVFGKPNQDDRRRAAEIISAVGKWQAATKRAEDAAGYTAACQASDQAVARCSDLRRQIIFARAYTADGMMAKVHAMCMLFPDDPMWVRQRLEEAVAKNDGADIARWFGMSLALDTMGMEGRALPASKPRSVAA